jgi:hypothetical protein
MRLIMLVLVVAALASGGTAVGFRLTDRTDGSASACDRAKEERSAVERVAIEEVGAGAARANMIQEAALVLGSPPHCFSLAQYREAYAQMRQALVVA